MSFFRRRCDCAMMSLLFPSLTCENWLKFCETFGMGNWHRKSRFSLGLGISVCLQTKAYSLGTNTAPINNLSHVYFCGKFRSTWNVFIRICKWEFRCFVTFLFSRRPRGDNNTRLWRAERTFIQTIPRRSHRNLQNNLSQTHEAATACFYGTTFDWKLAERQNSE